MSEAGTRSGDIVVQVHEQLREAILSGEVRPGEKTSQAELARDLDVGRTPLREAVRMLQSEGLILAQPNRRVEIASLSVADAEELYVMRIALEVAAARITLPSLTHSDLAELEGYMAQMSSLAASDAFFLIRAPHKLFHERFIAGAGPRPLRLMDELSDHAERYRRIYGAAIPDQFPLREVEHRSMVDAAARADAEGLADAIAVHYVHTARLVARALDPEHTLEHLRTTVAAVAPGALHAFE